MGRPNGLCPKRRGSGLPATLAGIIRRHSSLPVQSIWLFAIVRHKAIDTLRHHNRYKSALEQQQNESQINAAPDNSEQLEQNLDEGRLLNCLPPKYREVLTLTKIVGLSTAETASQLCISTSAVKVRVHRAIGSLRRQMEADTL